MNTNETRDDIIARNTIVFWGATVLYVCLAIATVIGNILVIYATHITKSGEFRDATLPKISGYLTNVIQSLAVADMLYGLLGIPFQLYGYHLGKVKPYF